MAVGVAGLKLMTGEKGCSLVTFTMLREPALNYITSFQATAEVRDGFSLPFTPCSPPLFAMLQKCGSGACLTLLRRHAPSSKPTSTVLFLRAQLPPGVLVGLAGVSTRPAGLPHP